MVDQGHEVEQRNHPEGVCGLHPQTAEGTAESPRDGGETEEAGEHQPLPAAPHTGEGGEGGEGGRRSKFSEIVNVVKVRMCLFAS